jgi:hypothetical protein
MVILKRAQKFKIKKLNKKGVAWWSCNEQNSIDQKAAKKLRKAITVDYQNTRQSRS